MKPSTDSSEAFSRVLIALLKGVVWREDEPAQWQRLLALQHRLRDHVEPMGLWLDLDETEGYALFRQRQASEGDELPRLIPKRPLSYPVSLLLVLLRKRLAEADGGDHDRRVLLKRDELVELMQQFFKDSSNQARQVDQILGHINKVRDLGFLRPLKGRDGEYEVVRLLKSFVDAELLARLEVTYQKHAAALGKEAAE